MKKIISVFIFSISVIAFLYWGTVRIIRSVQADQSYIGYIKRAADANSVGLAKQELSKAVAEIERRGLTSGYTSIFWRTPDEDLSFWYTNLKTSLEELNNLPSTSTSLEKSNMLIKLRETLLDSNKDGDSVTYPDGISIYPDNKSSFWVALISFILAVASLCMIRFQREHYGY